MAKADRNAGNLELVGGRLCLDFVNTATARDSAGHRNYLTTYEALLAWGRHAGVISAKQYQILATIAARNPQAASAALSHSVTLRETIYRLVGSAIRGHRPASTDLLQVNRTFQEACQHRTVLRRGTGFEWGWEFDSEDLQTILWPVVLSATDLMTSPDISRVRQCSRRGCQWMFFDSSKNGSRRWCSMAVCGSRMKSQRYYHRNKKANP